MSRKHETDKVEPVEAENYEQARERMATEQAGKSAAEIMASLPAEYKFDLNNIPSQNHNWVKRGINPTIVVCEGANHPSHRHTLRK